MAVIIGAGGAGNGIFTQNDTTITVDTNVPATNNTMCIGPITINTGITVTIDSGGQLLII